MARLDDIAEPMRSHLRDLPCPTFEETPWTEGPALKDRRVALISTAGLQRRTEAAGQALQQYLSSELARVARSRTMSKIIARIEERSGGPLTLA